MQRLAAERIESTYSHTFAPKLYSLTHGHLDPEQEIRRLSTNLIIDSALPERRPYVDMVSTFY